MAHHHRILFLFLFYVISARAQDNSTHHHHQHHHECCVRHKKLVSIGFDTTGNDYYVDIGQCRHYCLSDNFSDPIHSCKHGYSCHPSIIRRETHDILQGPKQTSVIVSCSCYEKIENCQRQSEWLRLFDDSPYQVDVDVGVCRGACSSVVGEYCQPLKNRTESVTGPNGAVCVEVIEECACTPPCYRMNRTSVYFDVSWNATDANATGEQNLITKEIDVGVCVGVCTSPQGHLCVLRDTKDSSKCLMSLTENAASSSSCTPSAYTTHRLKNGRVVLAVSDCGC